MSSLDSKIVKNKAKNESIEKALIISQEEDSLDSAVYALFDEWDGFKVYLIFQPIHKYIKVIANTKYISEWKSKGMSDESIKPFPSFDNSLTPLIDYYGYYIRLKFNGSILRQPKVSYTHERSVNIYIVYELGASSSHINDPILKNCLFGAVALTKNADIYKYCYSDYEIRFDRRSNFRFPGGGFGQNI